MSQYTQNVPKDSTKLIEIIHSRYFNKHVNHIQCRNSWKIV